MKERNIFLEFFRFLERKKQDIKNNVFLDRGVLKASCVPQFLSTQLTAPEQHEELGYPTQDTR